MIRECRTCKFEIRYAHTRYYTGCRLQLDGGLQLYGGAPGCGEYTRKPVWRRMLNWLVYGKYPFG